MATEPAWGVAPQANAWADAVDEEEAQHGVAAPLPLPEDDFPSLGAAVKQGKDAGAKTKKPKGQKMDLGVFLGGAARHAAPSRNNDNELLMALPKASSGLPREEGGGRLGGAFKDYGGQRDGFRGGRGRDGEEGYERPISKADTSSNWGSERKFVPSDGAPRAGGGGGGGGFGSSFGGRDRDRDGAAAGGREERRSGFDDRPRGEADSSDNWGANRKFVPAEAPARGGGGGAGGFGGGGGFKDREGGFREGTRPRYDEPSRADGGDWGSRRAPGSPPGGAAAERGARRGFGFSEAPNSAADTEDRWVRRGAPAEPSSGAPAAAAGPSERPRLNLAPRTKPVEAVKPATPADGATPPSSTASPTAAAAAGAANGTGPSSSDGSTAAAAGPPKQKVNPFGAARPREEVLKEKGIDYVKEELKLEHGEVIRDPTPEELEMEKEVKDLQQQLQTLMEAQPGEVDTLEQMKQELDDKERQLYRLQAELDDRVRFSKDRPEREAGPRGPTIDPREEAEFTEVRGARRPRPAGAPEGGEGVKPAGGPPPPPAAAGAGGGGGAGGSRGWERPGGAGGGGFGGGGFKERREGPAPPPRRDGPPRDGPPPPRGRDGPPPPDRRAAGW